MQMWRKGTKLADSYESSCLTPYLRGLKNRASFCVNDFSYHFFSYHFFSYHFIDAGKCPGVRCLWSKHDAKQAMETEAHCYHRVNER